MDNLGQKRDVAGHALNPAGEHDRQKLAVAPWDRMDALTE